MNRKYTLTRDAGGQLWHETTVRRVPVRAVRCFPWSDPGRMISLRDTQNHEVALVDDPGTLEASSRTALATSLAEASLLFEIEQVIAIDEEVELRRWEVRTAQGTRRFQTRLDEWPRDVPGGGLLIRDVAGDLYLIRDPESLDGASQSRLWAFVD